MKNLTLFFLLLPFFVISQTGPGGIGTNDGTSSLKIWYRPDFGISTTGAIVDTWTNTAGVTAHNLTSTGGNRPTLVSSAVNGFDELSFDGNDYLGITGSLTTSNFIKTQSTVSKFLLK